MGNDTSFTLTKLCSIPLCSIPRSIPIVATLAFLLSSCAGTPSATPSEHALEMLDQAVEDLNQPIPEAPSILGSTLLAPPSQTLTTIEETERFDISVNQVTARAFFLGLVKGSNRNIVVHPDVTGNITLELNNVSIEETLKVCRDIYGYEYKFKDSIYTIFPSALRTEIFPINYLDVKRVGLSDTSVLVGKVENSNNNSNNGNNSNGQDNSSLLGLLNNISDNGNQRSTTSTPGARIQTLTTTDFWSSLQQAVEALIGGLESGRNVTVTPQAGLVIVKALPNELQVVRDFLERSSLSIKRQVLLEAKVVEVRLSDEFNAGINWNAISGNVSQWRNISSVGSDGTTVIDDTLDDTFFSVLEINDINDVLNLMSTQGSVQVLSSPRVATVNNQKAVIRVGTDEFFVTGLSSDTTTGGGDTVVNSPDIELTSFFSGIALDVTPQIASDGEIVLHIHPVITTVSDQVKELRIGDQLFNFPLALRDIRESDSVVKAQSGQVIVLGGLMQDAENISKGKHPGLGDVPIVGNSLFRQKTSSKTKTELVILLKPTVIDSKTTSDSLMQSRDRIKAMGETYQEKF